MLLDAAPRVLFITFIWSSSWPKAATVSPLMMSPAFSASVPSCLKAWLPLWIRGFRSDALLPSRVMARASRSVWLSTWPRASTTSNITVWASLKLPLLSRTLMPSWAKAAEVAALSLVMFFVSLLRDPVRVSTLTSMNWLAYSHF